MQFYQTVSWNPQSGTWDVRVVALKFLKISEEEKEQFSASLNTHLIVKMPLWVNTFKE